MSKLREIIDYINRSKFSKEQSLEFLKKVKSIDATDKNLIYLYLYPRILLDRELPGRVMSYRKAHNKAEGSTTLDKNEAALLIEAYKTPQYHRYMLHLYHAFGNKISSNDLKIYPLDYNVDDDECPICGKKIVGIEEVDKLPVDKSADDYVGYTSKTSNSVLCKSCVIQLLYSGELLEELEPGYLHT